ncbi:hypothetical protein M5K25_001934 [Dendrobium thyrsiflorum]|uniref:Uncharacterized protein n=1 Tax=Dendrobium thyrsiflorum TaxID=117978 RepID=A0ABD0VRM3_DENTH
MARSAAELPSARASSPVARSSSVPTSSASRTHQNTAIDLVEQSHAKSSPIVIKIVDSTLFCDQISTHALPDGHTSSTPSLNPANPTPLSHAPPEPVGLLPTGDQDLDASARHRPSNSGTSPKSGTIILIPPQLVNNDSTPYDGCDFEPGIQPSPSRQPIPNLVLTCDLCSTTIKEEAKEERIYDVFGTGHSFTSIYIGLGIAEINTNDMEVCGKAIGSDSVNNFTAGVKIPCLKLIAKDDPTLCSQVVRCNVTEGFDPKFVISGDEVNVMHGDRENKSQAAHSQRQRGKNIVFVEVADHIRKLSFAIVDASHPENEGREYVLKVMVNYGTEVFPPTALTYTHPYDPYILKVLLDSGIVQTTALTVDHLASLDKNLETAILSRALILKTEVEWLKSIKADLVIFYVVPVECRAAPGARIRSICVTNFRWDYFNKKTPVSAWGSLPSPRNGEKGGRAVLSRRKSGSVLCRRKSGSLPSPRSGEKGVVLCRHQGVVKKESVL